MTLDEVENFKHSLMLDCRSCHIWGCPLNHENGEPCGNCGSKETIAYYPISRKKLFQLLTVIKAAKKHCEGWKEAKEKNTKHDFLCIPIRKMRRGAESFLDPEFRYEPRLGLSEALEELEKK